mgnify:CR=1 FL=1
MSKSYSDYMNEISADELYKGLLAYGLFNEKLPPVFTSEPFYNYAPIQPFSDKPHGFIFHESMRDINIPRSLGIPNPMAYQRLCECLKDNWTEIQSRFERQTNGDSHKISRVHIRKQKGTEALFKMNYKNWRTDDLPVPDILIGKKYMVSADISTCFPSMYTHSLCWALVGKDTAKNNRNRTLWFNELDHRCMNLRSNETHGFLIGPHASNLLSEIILTVVDSELGKKWDYVRNIDDYTCYVDSYEKAREFLTDIGTQLRRFDLSLNHRKTKIELLPVASTRQWVRQLNTFDLATAYGKVDFKKAQAYLDLAVALMEENNGNAAVLNYAIKVLSKRKLTKNARNYTLKTIMHFAVIYPYLIPLLDEYIFKPLAAPKEDVECFSNIVFNNAAEEKNYEALIYAIFFSLTYDFDISGISAALAIQENSCLLKIFTWIYFNRRKKRDEIKALKKHARDLSQNENDLDENWLFIYEVLPQSDLKNEWKPMKKANVSFIKQEFRDVKP